LCVRTTITIGADVTVNRLGFGAMRLCGPGVWGWPPDRENALRVLRRAVELGVQFIDTADAYGPQVNERQIAAALHPYPSGLVIATKGGCTRAGPGQWGRDGRPEHLRAACEQSLRRLRLDRIDLYQLHAVDRSVPFEEQIGALRELREEGKIRHVGLCNVSVAQVERARAIVPVVSVQNEYNVERRESEAVLDFCEAHGMTFIPYFPLGGGDLHVDRVAALRWLLARSACVLPIPGTSKVAHLEENMSALQAA
jgi:pyridoxine 4-dehydrogenase